MAHNLITENIVVNLQADSFGKLCDNGYIRIKTKDNILLAELKFELPAFKPAVNGILKTDKIAPELSVKKTGKAFRYEVYNQDGETKLLTGTVGKIGEGFDLELTDINLIAGMQINIISFKHEVLKK